VLTVYFAARHCEALPNAKPIKYKGFVLPEYFNFTAYFRDTDGTIYKPEKLKTLKTLKTWSVQLLIRVRPGSIEILTTTIRGVNKKHDGHVLFSTDDPLAPENFLPIKPIYYRIVSEHRPNLMAFAITDAVQTLVFTESADGTRYKWPFGLSRRDLTEKELQALGRAEINNSYKKKDPAFYEWIASEYEKAVSEGDRPNSRLQQLTGKNLKTVQGYVTEARKRKLLLKAEPGKVSPVRKVRKAGKK
jgi:hypothetical protein